jgi:ABC-type nickel/cobalt efflux system permease component RcnA
VSLTLETQVLPSAASWPRRLAVMAGALALVAGLMWLLAIWLASPAPPPPVRAPFGGLREAAPAATGLGGLILAWQGQFYRALTTALMQLRQGGGPWLLVGLSFAYGAFHAAGPGHGKSVIAAYLVADRAAWWRGFSLSLGAALVQALVALVLVGVLALVLNSTAARINATTRHVELASFAAVGLLGLWLTWRQAGRWLNEPAHACEPGCHHASEAPPPARTWRETAGVVLAAGLRPCTGAIVVLVFALSQKIAWAGVVATFAMALGTALTTGILAALAIGAKRLALTLAGGRPGPLSRLAPALELLAAAFVCVLGASLLAGLMTGEGWF